MAKRETILFLDCHGCGRRVEQVWAIGSGYTGPVRPDTLVCRGFVRGHYHQDGECMKWWGLRAESPRVCAECGSDRLVETYIRGKVSEQVCGDKCLTARGPACECSCGGHNHGRAAHGA